MDSSLRSLSTARAFFAERFSAKASVTVVLIAALTSPITAATNELLPPDADQAAASSGIPEPTTALLVGIFGLCLILLRQGRN